MAHPLLVDGWEVNLSQAVLRLDVPLIEDEEELQELHASYSDALAAAREAYPIVSVLPSINLIDGKAKQFDDGLFAAAEQAYYEGVQGRLTGHVDLVRRLYERVGPDSTAAPYLAAGLELAGVEAPVRDRRAKARLLHEFEAAEHDSKPAGFYTWNDTLSRCFQFLRFFGRPMEDDAADAIVGALAGNPDLLADYRRALEYLARMTNPAASPTVADLLGGGGRRVRDVVLFPRSLTRERILFASLFPNGLPRDANLMRALIEAIQSGRVDLAPDEHSGWLEHQVYALETLLLPERGEEHYKLLLTAAYKRRMLEAFAAQLTQRHETHRRGGEPAYLNGHPPPPPARIAPQLRVEPCPSYYVRTARAYAFLLSYVETASARTRWHRCAASRQTARATGTSCASCGSCASCSTGCTW